MVRHWFLVPVFGGSNPSSPAKMIMLKDSIHESFCYDIRMFIKPSKIQYLLLSVSLVLFILYYTVYQLVNLNGLIETDSVSLSILLAILPLLFISIIPSYVLAKIIKANNPPFIVTAVLFSIFYIVITFVSLVITFAIGGLA